MRNLKVMHHPVDPELRQWPSGEPQDLPFEGTVAPELQDQAATGPAKHIRHVGGGGDGDDDGRAVRCGTCRIGPDAAAITEGPPKE
jgi:hypothetical protein